MARSPPRAPGWSCKLSRIHRFGAPVAAFLLSALLAAPASADAIMGRLSILGTVRLDLDDIEFQAPVPLINNFLVSLPSDGYFAGIQAVSISGSALDLHLGMPPVGVPVGVPFSLPGFLSSFQGSTLSFELNLIQPGAFDSDCGGSPASRQVCSPV